jgi:SAM-dependent methyltransferase
MNRSRATSKRLAATTERVREYWERRATESRSDSERIDQSPRTQRMRYEAFLQLHDLRNASILDVGCGVGDLYTLLRRRGLKCDYTGFDLSVEMVRICRKRFPRIKFASGDFLAWKPRRRFDYVVSFGIHNNVCVGQGWELLCATTRRQFELAKHAAHVSLLTDRYAGFGPQAQPWSAERVLSACLGITPFVVLRHDYLPNDFCVTLYREPLIDRWKGPDLS